jgi:hypothetical protein
MVSMFGAGTLAVNDPFEIFHLNFDLGTLIFVLCRMLLEVRDKDQRTKHQDHFGAYLLGV